MATWRPVSEILFCLSLRLNENELHHSRRLLHFHGLQAAFEFEWRSLLVAHNLLA
ncbi:unnamed protein product [Callosobruchus maculatus]|uniref:Uncharacterized protein n=1 Tax=Callosobruchus maculatus TaxID=64391 RepID=A0A653D221_CALMS|nr:unnamed protein product [Callosobruchus maculatus]